MKLSVVNKTLLSFIVLVLLASCALKPPASSTPEPSLPIASATPLATSTMQSSTAIPSATQTLTPTASPTSTPTPVPSLVPRFSHIVIIVFENQEYGSIIGNPQMPFFNQMAQQYTLLNQHYAIRHPSLPNYIAMVSGDTFGIEVNNPKILIEAPSLPDLFKEAGISWKTYQESMTSRCGIEDNLEYVRKHNPFVWFKSVIEDPACEEHIVPLEQLQKDFDDGTLPQFIFITPNLCHSIHDHTSRPECSHKNADDWLKPLVEGLLQYPAIEKDGLIILTWDEGQGEHTCCNLLTGGGRIPTVFISPLAKNGFIDETPYTLYSILRLISESWGLPLLKNAASPDHLLPVAPWKED